MLAIEVNFLTGRFVATAHNARDQHEWPPHPVRLYSALVATWAESGENAEEREALKWLEAQPPPELTYSKASRRSIATHYVPVNEERAVKQTKNWFIDHRLKQGRFFPSVTPEEPRVTYIWGNEPPEGLREVLDGLLERVTRLGHSSSLVASRLTDKPPPANLVPGKGKGSEILRCPRATLLDNLGRLHLKHKGVDPRVLPSDSVSYREVVVATDDSDPVQPDTAGEWVILEFSPGSRRLPVTRVVEVAGTLRKAILSHAQDPIPEGLSGHQSSGAPTALAHAAFLAIPYVGFEYADGRIMGAAVSLPTELDEASRQAALRAIGKWEGEAGVRDKSMQLTFSGGSALDVERKPRLSDLRSLRPEVWSRPSTTWVSATPIALPTNPGRLSQGTASARAKAWERAEQAVAASCRHVGLPEPARVSVSLDPFLNAARPAAHFPPFRQRGSGGRPVARRLVHAKVEFDGAVQGPLMLGSGRFTGLGLMRPIDTRPQAEPQQEPESHQEGEERGGNA